MPHVIRNFTREDTITLSVLVATLEDGRRGFATVADALDGADRPDLAETMRRFGAERGHMSDRLRRFAADNGEFIRANGSVAGAVHRSWISVSDALIRHDPRAIMSAAEEGELHAIETLEEILDEGAVSADLRALVAEQTALVRATHDQVRALRDGLL